MIVKQTRVRLLIFCLVAFTLLVMMPFMSADALEVNSWLSDDSYYVSETALPANQVPYSKGVDCQKATIVDPVTSKVYTDCAVMTAAGPIISQTYTDGVRGFGRVSTIFLPSVGKTQLAYTGSNIIVYKNGLERSNFAYSKSNNIEDATYTYMAQNDFAIKHKSSSRAISIGPSSIAYSNNGKWMVALAHDGTVGYGIMLFETENYTGRMIAYDTSVNEDASLGIPIFAVSDDGRYIATGYSYAAIGASKIAGVRVYDTTTCTDVFGVRPTVGRDCSYKNLWTGKVNGSTPFSEVSGGKGMYQQMTGKPLRPLNVRFKDDATISFSAIHDFVPKSDFQASEYTVSLNPPVLAAETINLMALGDSYISGEGAEHTVGSNDVSHYVLGTNTKNNKCHNSDLSYPYLLGAKYADTYHSVA